MLNNLKRYGMALLLLLLVIIMMLLGTLGVKSFGDKMFEDANITIQPQGERIEL
ncbi:hypothetical protein [Sulfurimonas sp.]